MQILDHALDLSKAMLRGSRAAAILLPALLAACQTMADRSAIPVATTTAPSEARKGGTVVFGKVTVLSSKAPPRWTETSCDDDIYWTCPDSFRLILVKDGDSDPIRHRLTGDGRFFWSLTPGRYYVAEWEWQMKGQPQTSSISGRIGGYFEVTAGETAAYLGDVVIAFQGRRFAVGVQDRSAEAAAAYQARFSVPSIPATSLLTIAGVPNGTEGGISNICADKWGLACTKDRRGVEVVSPAQHEDTFPAVASLTPTLAWHPSSNRAVTYDIVIYDAIAYGTWPRTRYLQGRIVATSSGLTEPSFTPPEQLAPGRKYFWSVRLRQGDAVSTWSTMGFHKVGFFIVAIVSKGTSGSPFRFETP